MARTGAATFEATVASELITYLGAGTLNGRELSRTIRHDDTEIANLDQLKQLRFVLHSPVVSYLESVPEWLRRIKTDHRQQQEIVRGEIRGRIDWQGTQRVRSQAGYDDPTLFAITSPTVEYDLPENRVVKKLLSIIVGAIERYIPAAGDDWGAALTQDARRRITEVYHRNRYLEELPDADQIALSGRALNAARQSRHELYREAQRLYRLYDDLIEHRYTQPGVQELLEQTLITPTETHRLFELFCVFAIVRSLQETYPGLQLQTIQPEMDTLAELETADRRVEVYHDQTGPLSFYETLDGVDTPVDELPAPFRRVVETREDQQAALAAFLDQTDQSGLYAGRPDFLVIEYDTTGPTEQLTRVTIGECKYTASKQTFATGLRELVEYIHYVRDGEDYLFERPTADLTVQGIICSDQANSKTQQAGDIRHLQTADLLTFFPDE